MWSSSVDLAHHYALTYRISEQWTFTSSNDPTLGEMNTYPRGSHIIAAIVGTLVNSTFLGIQITALLSLALLWLGILLILNSLQARLAALSILCLTGLVVLNANASSLSFDLHGHEIMQNFFFSQLVGQAILFVGIYSAICVEKKRGALSATALLSALMLITAWIHLLPALEMLGVIVGLIVSYVFLDATSGTMVERNKLIAAIGIGLVAIAGIVLHPSFAAMRALSENNGNLRLHNIPYPSSLVFLALLVLLASLVILIWWMRTPNRNDNPAIKYLAFYGGASAALCLLQLMLTWLGQGSDYAVKKYGFSLTTILLIDLAIISAGVLDAKKVNLFKKNSRFTGYVFSGALSILFVFSVPAYKSLDVQEVVSFERNLTHLSETALPAPGHGKNNVVIGLNKMPNTINYMFSIAIAKTEREIAAQDVYRRNNLSSLSSYSYVISSFDNPDFGASNCNTLSSGALSIVSTGCIVRRLAKTAG